jgi:hypothetical protein
MTHAGLKRYGADGLAEWRRLTRPIPEATPRHGIRTRLTVGMATFDDFDGVWFTLASLVLHHPEVADDLSLVVIDNNPGGSASDSLKALEKKFPRYRYVPFRSFRGTCVRDLVFREAEGEVVVCLDSHVLLRPGALAAIVAYFEDRPGCLDLVQGPLVGESGRVVSTHLAPIWAAHFFGQFRCDSRADGTEPYELESMGLGMFACRKEAWPGFSPLLRGFGGEEGYIHEKFRLRGGRTIGLPAAGWAHRFDRPAGAPYPNRLVERLRNYALAWDEVGLDFEPGRQHFREVGMPQTLLDAADAAVAHPLNTLDAVFVANRRQAPQRWQNALAWGEQLQMQWRIERLPLGDDAEPLPDCLCALDSAVAEAQRRGLHSLLFLGDDVAFAANAREAIDDARKDLAGEAWDVWTLDPSGLGAAVPDTDTMAFAAGTSAAALALRGAALARVRQDAAASCGQGQHQTIGDWCAEASATLRVVGLRPAVASVSDAPDAPPVAITVPRT